MRKIIAFSLTTIILSLIAWFLLGEDTSNEKEIYSNSYKAASSENSDGKAISNNDANNNVVVDLKKDSESIVVVETDNSGTNFSEFERSTFNLTKVEENGEVNYQYSDSSIEDKSDEEIAEILEELARFSYQSQDAIENKYELEQYFQSFDGHEQVRLERVECGESVCLALFEEVDFNFLQGPPLMFIDERSVVKTGVFERIKVNDSLVKIAFLTSRKGKGLLPSAF